MLPAAIEGTGEGRRRTATSIFIAAFALAAIGIPLRYYLGNDPYDERFSWRMFSAVRMQECKIDYQEETRGAFRSVNLDTVLEPTWTGMMRRQRDRVVSRFLESRCGRLGLTRTRLLRQCRRTTGEALPMIELVRDCRTGEERRRP